MALVIKTEQNNPRDKTGKLKTFGHLARVYNILIFLGFFLAIGAIVLHGFLTHPSAKSINSFFCKNNVIDTRISPNGTKKAVVFVRDCGATTDWSTEASILNANSSLSDGDTGNVLSIDSNDEKAWPLAPKGWALISPEWSTDNSLELYYSSNSSVSYQKNLFNDVQLQFATITPQFYAEE